MLIAHLDADCFYVSAERVRDRFLLAKPVGGRFAVYDDRLRKNAENVRDTTEAVEFSEPTTRQGHGRLILSPAENPIGVEPIEAGPLNVTFEHKTILPWPSGDPICGNGEETAQIGIATALPLAEN